MLGIIKDPLRVALVTVQLAIRTSCFTTHYRSNKDPRMKYETVLMDKHITKNLTLLDLITVLFITRYTRRPLHLFGSFGLIFLMAGLGINGYLAILWFGGHNLSNRPLLLLGVLLMLLGIQVLTTGLIGEMITFKNFRRRDSYSIKEWLE